MNLKYSKDVVKDYDKLSDGRKGYITKRAEKKGISVFEYLTKKIEERCKIEREAKKREQKRIANKQERKRIKQERKRIKQERKRIE